MYCPKRQQAKAPNTQRKVHLTLSWSKHTTKSNLHLLHPVSVKCFFPNEHNLIIWFNSCIIWGKKKRRSSKSSFSGFRSYHSSTGSKIIHAKAKNHKGFTQNNVYYLVITPPSPFPTTYIQIYNLN